MSFLDKLKQNIGIEETEIKTDAETPEPKTKGKKTTATTGQSPAKKIKVKDRNEEPQKKSLDKKFTLQNLDKQEGELAVDVYQTKKEIVIQSAIAGVEAEDLDISVENDVVEIKGKREEMYSNEEKNYFYQECYWGSFRRRIILPEEVDNSRATAELKQGILVIRIPKIQKNQKRKIAIKT